MELLDNIRIFKRVTEKASFSAVAKEMNLSQPTISKSIKSLEEYLGVILLRRSTRGFSLTSAGQKLVVAGAPLLDQMDVLLASVKEEKLHLEGQLRIAASSAFTRLIIAPLFDEFAKLQPRLRFHFNLSDGYVDLIENNIDLAIRIGDMQDSSLKALKIGCFKRSLYVANSYIKNNGKPKSLADLHKHRLLYHTRLSDRPLWPLQDHTEKSIPFHFEPYLQTDGSDLMREANINGLGIALLPTWMMIEPEKQKKVIRIFEEYTSAKINIYAVTTPAKELTAKQRVVIDFLRNKFEKIPELSIRA